MVVGCPFSIFISFIVEGKKIVNNWTICLETGGRGGRFNVKPLINYKVDVEAGITTNTRTPQAVLFHLIVSTQQNLCCFLP